MDHPKPLFCLFLSFQTNITIFKTKKCVNVHPVYLHCWDKNPQPSDHESPPITTRPGLPPLFLYCYLDRFDLVGNILLCV